MSWTDEQTRSFGIIDFENDATAAILAAQDIGPLQSLLDSTKELDDLEVRKRYRASLRALDREIRSLRQGTSQNRRLRSLQSLRRYFIRGRQNKVGLITRMSDLDQLLLNFHYSLPDRALSSEFAAVILGNGPQRRILFSSQKDTLYVLPYPDQVNVIANLQNEGWYVLTNVHNHPPLSNRLGIPNRFSILLPSEGDLCTYSSYQSYPTFHEVRIIDGRNAMVVEREEILALARQRCG